MMFNKISVTSSTVIKARHSAMKGPCSCTVMETKHCCVVWSVFETWTMTFYCEPKLHCVLVVVRDFTHSAFWWCFNVLFIITSQNTHQTRVLSTPLWIMQDNRCQWGLSTVYDVLYRTNITDLSINTVFVHDPSSSPSWQGRIPKDISNNFIATCRFMAFFKVWLFCFVP